MSDAETSIPQASGDTHSPEIAKSNENDIKECTPSIGAENAPAIVHQNIPAECVESATSINSGDTSVIANSDTEVPVKEITTERRPEIVPDNTAAIDIKTTAEAPVEDANLKKSAGEEKVDAVKVPEIQQLESIGAGDPCLILKPNQTDETITPIVENTTPTSQDKSVIKADNKETDASQIVISRLKQTVQKTTEERNSYQKKLENTEKKLAALQASYDALVKGGGNEVILRHLVEQLRGNLVQSSLQLEDRARIVATQEKQINALNNQVASLKEVETLTRSLLQIRNMEVKHLQTEVNDMEGKITEERERYNSMINKMDAAVRLNSELKKEYETQLCLFKDLREKYEEKVTLLSEEKKALEATAQPTPN